MYFVSVSYPYWHKLREAETALTLTKANQARKSFPAGKGRTGGRLHIPNAHLPPCTLDHGQAINDFSGSDADRNGQPNGEEDPSPCESV
jgi:hypothetical protein